MENTIEKINELIKKIETLTIDKDNISVDNLDINREEMYDNFLDDCYEPYKIGSIEFYASDILKSCDPIAYRCGMNDYFSDVDVTDFSQYNDKVDEIDEQIEEIKQEIHDIIEDL